MSAIGINGVFARIASIEQRVSSMWPAAGPSFQDVFTSVTDQQPETTSMLAVAPRPVTLGDVVAGTLPGTAPAAIPAEYWFAAADWTTALPAAAHPYVDAITEAATEAGIDPALLAALVWTESNFRADAVSRSGAIGLAQLMPGTAEGLGVDPTDPAANLAGGARYLSYQIDRFGSLELALAAYNAGPGRVREAGGIPDIPETQAYVPKVLDRYRLLGGTP